MPSLYETAREELLHARKNVKAGEFHRTKLDLLRTLIGAVQTRAINQRRKNEPIPDEEVSVVAKKLLDSAEENKAAAVCLGRPAIKYEDEIIVLERYIPRMMSPAELTDAIADILEELEDTIWDLGTVMKELKVRFPGRYDGKLASTIAKTLLESRNAPAG